MATEKRTGKRSSFSIGGTAIGITKVTPKHTVDLVEATDSGDYDPTDDLIHKSFLPCTTETEVAIEGRYKVTETPASLIAKLYDGSTEVQISIGVDAGTIYGSGKAYLSDFEADMPIDDIVNYKATAKVTGKFTRGA